MPAREPSTSWKEQVAADETQRFEKYATILTEIQKAKSATFGNGRTLHRKQLLGLEATLTVGDNLPAAARHGIFATPKTYSCLVRLSNGGMNIRSDKEPDIRGFAIKVLGLDGPSALGQGRVNCQDFLLINHENFSSKGVDPFIGVVQAASRGNGALLAHMFRTHGLLGGFAQLRRALAMFGKPFTGFATEPFNTVVPHACGPYAMRVRIAPASAEVNANAKDDWARDVRARLEKGPLVHDVQLQFFVDESVTPIEDASVAWSVSESPLVTVARLTIPTQAFEGPEAEAREKRVAETFFDPWNGLADHRPLGEVQRARKFAYFASQKGRGAKPA